MRPIIIVSVVLAVTAVTGCSTERITKSSGASTAATSAANSESFCEAYCQKINGCDSSSDLQTCTESCDDAVSSTMDNLRADVVTEVQTCWEKSDCRQVLSGERLGDCVDEAAVSVAPNASAKSFCDSLAASLDKCDAGIDRADCLETVKVYGDAAIAQATKCTTKSCSAIMDCVNATL